MDIITAEEKHDMYKMQQRLYRIRTLDERKAYDKQYKASHRERIKQYKEENREQAREYAKTYRQEHKDIVQIKSKQYYETNKCAILEHSKQQWTCTICKCTCQLNGKARHLKTQQHQNNLNPKPQTILELSDGTIVTGIDYAQNDGSIMFKTKEYDNLTDKQMIEILDHPSYRGLGKIM